MEGGVDEELDYDVAEDFQDDDENNTFYHDQEEEEETKYQEVSWLCCEEEADDDRNKSRRNSDSLTRHSVIGLRSTRPKRTTRMICLEKAN
jgi:hypothetical protein